MRDAGTWYPTQSRIPHAASRIPQRHPHPVVQPWSSSRIDAQFCSIAAAVSRPRPLLARCGTALESDAHYCHSCGARVAA